MSEVEYDVIIIGAGPAGLYSSFCCGMRQLKVKILEARESLGGKMLLYQERLIWDVGGAQGKLGSDIAVNILQESQQFSPEVVLNQKVTAIEKQSDGFRLTTQHGTVYQAKTVILASSLGIIQPRKLKLDVADDYCNLHYLVSEIIDFKDYADQTVLLYGNPDSLADYVSLLQK
ncbi:MAG: NAD(P)/FAD-dependent oxidoreductase [Streptococcaceae bacterium]|jgi:thioredoxin reductase (NADPH)|nr:NAD(P)/FAD-dependent oxidoreductase [Streptococcaceae bacterium]